MINQKKEKKGKKVVFIKKTLEKTTNLTTQNYSKKSIFVNLDFNLNNAQVFIEQKNYSNFIYHLEFQI